MRICQLQNIILSLLIATFFSSCSSLKIADNEKNHAGQVNNHSGYRIEPNWFKIPLTYAMRDQGDNYLNHPFFDVDPGFKKDLRRVNFFVTTPDDSLFKYNFDLYSGKLYKERDYCLIADVWSSYKKDLFKPNFIQGIVPRTYDKNLDPQRIVIFSSANDIVKFKYSPVNYDTAKIVGSVILEICENYPCNLHSSWKQAQILIAVNERDQNYLDVKSLDELKNKVDLNYFSAFLVNQGGAHQIGKKYHPSFRITKEYEVDETIKYFETNSTTVKMDELNKWREGCFKLYGDIWGNSEQIRNNKYDQQAKFLKFFKEFYANKSEQFYSCQKLVRPANINENVERLWFFTYMQAFVNLEKNGFYFSCHDKSWFYNPKKDDTHYFYDQAKELEKCNPRDFEKSFDQAINGLSLMRNQINKNFRFIEYDTQRGGSHQKIYGWIFESAKKLDCKKQNNTSSENHPDLFPQDVVWKDFTPDDEHLISK